MPDTEYPPAREPTPEEYRIQRTFLIHDRSVPSTAYALGIERRAVVAAVMRVRWFRQDSGWNEEFAKARRAGFSEGDSELRAGIVADYNTRKARGEA